MNRRLWIKPSNSPSDLMVIDVRLNTQVMGMNADQVESRRSKMVERQLMSYGSCSERIWNLKRRPVEELERKMTSFQNQSSRELQDQGGKPGKLIGRLQPRRGGSGPTLGGLQPGGHTHRRYNASGIGALRLPTLASKRVFVTIISI